MSNSARRRTGVVQLAAGYNTDGDAVEKASAGRESQWRGCHPAPEGTVPTQRSGSQAVAPSIRVIATVGIPPPDWPITEAENFLGMLPPEFEKVNPIPSRFQIRLV
ncbi:MAG: hypothetical protein ACRD3F_00945 [Acidobacteriaceae bacterium]